MSPGSRQAWAGGDPPVVLTVAGSDSSGRAGIQADLKTFAALGVEGLSAITALTAQGAPGLCEVQLVPPEFVARQISVAAAGHTVAAAKTGMPGSAATVRVVARALGELGMPALVVDPVMTATSGEPLADAEAIRAMVSDLFPMALVVTPNLAEASALAGGQVSTLGDMEQAAARIGELGPAFVLVKGGHLAGDPTDVLFDGANCTRLTGARIESRHSRGTGCKLSAAIAAYVAFGEAVPAAVAKAKEFVTGVLRKG